MNLLSKVVQLTPMLAAVSFYSTVSANDLSELDCESYRDIIDYRYETNEMETEYRRYSLAPSGSREERRALENATRAAELARSILRTGRDLTAMSYRCHELLGEGEYRKFSLSTSGSLKERHYLEATRIIFDVGTDVLRSQLDPRLRSYRVEDYLAEGERIYRQYSLATSGSLKETFYLRNARLVYGYLEESVGTLVREGRLYFEEIGRMGEDLYSRYSRASSGSLPEQAFLKSARSAFDGAALQFRRESFRMSRDSLVRVETEYDRKQRRASSGSLLEKYYRSIVEIAGREIDRRR